MGAPGRCRNGVFGDRSRYDSARTNGSAHGYFRPVCSREDALRGRGRRFGLRCCVAVVVVGVGASARGAVAQDPVVRRDTTVTDTAAARRDSLAKVEAERLRQARLRAADTIKAPIARAEVPRSLAIANPYAWNREGLFATGALTLGELVDRIPGVTSFRAGWISAPEMAAVNGRFGRVRIFLDGIELDPLNSRLQGQHDLSLIDLWNLEDATIEPGADEVRVHLRSWRVASTTPVTRIDIHTGDLQTNAYRGFYGRRFPGGQVVQLGGNHYATTDRRTSEAGDQTSLWGRIGMARGKWSVDGSLLRSGRKFTVRTFGDATTTDTLPTMDGISMVAIGRAAWGDASSGPWFQAIASAQSFSIRNPPLVVIDSVSGPGGGGPGGSPTEHDTLEVENDTTQSRPQFVLTGGLTRGPVRFSALGRIRRWRGETTIAPAVRVGYEAGGLALSLLGERAPLDSVQRIEAGASFNFLGRFAVAGSASRFTPIRGVDAPTSLGLRAEAGVRFGRIWVTGGALRRDTSFLPAAIAFDSSFRSGVQATSTGIFSMVRGKFWRDVGVDLSGIRYESAGIYRPQYETRARLFLDTDMRAKFPTGNLNILLAVTHDYRTQALFPTADDFVESTQYRTWSADAEIRLLTATIFFQYRNFLAAEYQQVPGFTMPSITSIYGIRWNFIN